MLKKRSFIETKIGTKEPKLIKKLCRKKIPSLNKKKKPSEENQM